MFYKVSQEYVSMGRKMSIGVSRTKNGLLLGRPRPRFSGAAGTAFAGVTHVCAVSLRPSDDENDRCVVVLVC